MACMQQQLAKPEARRKLCGSSGTVFGDWSTVQSEWRPVAGLSLTASAPSFVLVNLALRDPSAHTGYWRGLREVEQLTEVTTDRGGQIAAHKPSLFLFLPGMPEASGRGWAGVGGSRAKSFSMNCVSPNSGVPLR